MAIANVRAMSTTRSRTGVATRRRSPSRLRGPLRALVAAAVPSLTVLGQGTPPPLSSTPTSPPTTTSAASQPAQSPTEELFSRKCASCHTVGKGNRVGPDLKDVHKRRARPWIEGLVKAPSALLDTDADARSLLAQFNNVRMPDLGIGDADVKGLVDLLIRCSSEPCNLVGKFTPVTTATAADFARGRELFLGLTPLQKGGAPCHSCHTVRGTKSAVPGGTLAKDLTHAFARLGDDGLDRALASPAFPLMNRVFADHPLEPAEVFAVRAFLYNANLGAEPKGEDSLSLTLTAILGAAGVLALLNAAWARRLRGVRGPLVAERPGDRNRERRTGT